MIYGDVCTGIGCASAAWKSLGWRPAFFAEIAKHPSAVLKHHYPDVPNLGDFTKIESHHHEPIDLLVGGTPCQDFSIAGLRAGVVGDRGNLTLQFLLLAQRARPRWIVWENVPGVLSSESHAAPDPCPPPDPVDLERDGQEVECEDDYNSEELHAFQCFLAGLSELGYGFAYRILDAQYVRVDTHPGAVPQRRRRVFVVGHLGDWRRAAAVLFERSCLLGDSPPRREAGQRIAPTISSRPTGGGGLGTDFDLDGGLIHQDYVPPIGIQETTATLDASFGRLQGASGQDMGHGHSHLVAHSLRGEGYDASEDGSGRATPIVPVAFDCKAGANTGFAVGDVPGALRGEGHGGGHAAIAFLCKDHGQDAQEDVTPTLRAMAEVDGNANGGGQITIAFSHAQITSPTNRSNPQIGDPSPSLASGGQPMAVAFQPRIGRNGRGYEENIAPALNGADAGTTSDMRPCVAIQERATSENPNAGPDGIGIRDDGAAFTMEARQTPQAVGIGHNSASRWKVRRLTPRECERLQGFSDDYTNVPYLGKDESADGPRYKDLGNSMARNVMRWLGQRIELVDKL